jgi:hypothetical protein
MKSTLNHICKREPLSVMQTRFKWHVYRRVVLTKRLKVDFHSRSPNHPTGKRIQEKSGRGSRSNSSTIWLAARCPELREMAGQREACCAWRTKRATSAPVCRAAGRIREGSERVINTAYNRVKGALRLKRRGRRLHYTAEAEPWLESI